VIEANKELFAFAAIPPPPELVAKFLYARDLSIRPPRDDDAEMRRPVS
jgi:hypothetical protein